MLCGSIELRFNKCAACVFNMHLGASTTPGACRWCNVLTKGPSKVHRMKNCWWNAYRRQQERCRMYSRCVASTERVRRLAHVFPSELYGRHKPERYSVDCSKLTKQLCIGMLWAHFPPGVLHHEQRAANKLNGRYFIWYLIPDECRLNKHKI